MENWKVALSSFMCTMQTCLHLKNTNHFTVILKARAVGMKSVYVELLWKYLHQVWREGRGFFLFFAAYPKFLMGILHNWSSAFPWGKCNHVTSIFFLCILRNWWCDPIGSLYLFTFTFVHFRILCYLGKSRGVGEARTWLRLLYCWFFLPLQRRCAFPNLILSWGEEGRNHKNDYQVGVGLGLGLVRGMGQRECESGGSSFGTGYNKLL